MSQGQSWMRTGGGGVKGLPPGTPRSGCARPTGHRTSPGVVCCHDLVSTKIGKLAS